MQVGAAGGVGPPHHRMTKYQCRSCTKGMMPVNSSHRCAKMVRVSMVLGTSWPMLRFRDAGTSMKKLENRGTILA
jgi:hypothetical protein